MVLIICLTPAPPPPPPPNFAKLLYVSLIYRRELYDLESSGNLSKVTKPVRTEVWIESPVNHTLWLMIFTISCCLSYFRATWKLNSISYQSHKYPTSSSHENINESTEKLSWILYINCLALTYSINTYWLVDSNCSFPAFLLVSLFSSFLPLSSLLPLFLALPDNFSTV